MVLGATITPQEIGFEYRNHGRFSKTRGSERDLRFVWLMKILSLIWCCRGECKFMTVFFLVVVSKCVFVICELCVGYEDSFLDFGVVDVSVKL